ncbi:MAG: chemotaxis protein CheA [Gaiellaceae bacterium]
MDVNEYLPMFLAEAREHLQELNLAVVEVEENPDGTDKVDEIFRIAHSLKGMSATMGFDGMAALTHEMENVFELLRERRGGLERAAIDVLLECLDALTGAVDSIDTEGAEKLEHEPLVERLRELIRGQGPATALTAPSTPSVEELLAGATGRVVHVMATLAEDTVMPAVRAFMVLSATGDHGHLVASTPAEAVLEGFDGNVVEVWIETNHETDAIVAAVRSVPDVAAATAEEALPVEAVPEVATGGGAHAKRGSSTVRVDAERLDQLMHLMGELVIHRTHVEALALQADVPGIAHAMQDLTRSSQALQAMVMQVRMVPVEAVFLRFPRLVRDLSTKLDKQVELVLTGKETELDRTVVDALGDPIVHLVRNSLDHGLEPEAERAAAGKPGQGTLEITARHAGGNVVIEVRDDGRGIDPQRVARKAAERGLISTDAVHTVDMKGAIELLFSAGFSTADVATDISGRGVGMDAVRTTIRELGGEVLLTSETGAGTTAQIRLPLTLAIMAALLVEAGGRPYAIQLDRVERTLRLADHTVRSVAGRQMLVQRDGVLPLVSAARALGYPETQAPTHAVIVRGSDQRLALAVDTLVGQRELVTRPLPSELGSATALSGGAVLSNGEIALIVDCDALAESTRGSIATLANAA